MKRFGVWLYRMAPWLSLALAAFLRLYNLTWKSVDFDEAFSWDMTHKAWGTLWADALMLRGDPHPPVYWVTLKGWLALAGDSELALRFVSAAAGIIFVALVYRLGRSLFSARAARLAMLWAALSPLFIWNSQDARMYMLGGAWMLAGMVCLVRGLQTRRWRWWGGYIWFTILGCYTHLAGSFLLPFEGLAILWAMWRWRRWEWRGLGALAAVGLAYGPYALNAWQASGPAYQTIRPVLSYAQLLHNATLLLAVNEARLTAAQQDWVVILIGAFFVGGVIGGCEPAGRPRWSGRAWVAGFYLLPLAVITVLSWREPVYQPKSLTFMGAALALGVGAGWDWLWQKRWQLGGLAGIVLLGVAGVGLNAVWRVDHLKEDWRHAVQYIELQAGAQDFMLVHLQHYRLPFIYYFTGPQPVAVPEGDWQTPGAAEATLAKYTGYDVIWLAQSGEYLTDPERQVQHWLEAHYPEVTEVYPSGVMVKGFAQTYRRPALPPEAQAAAVTYANGLKLVGYRVPQTRLPVNDIWLHPPSTWVHVSLYWTVTQPLAEDVRVAATLEDEAGNVWGGDLPRANDLRAFYPPLQWRPGEIVRQDLDVNVNPAVAPGEYKLVLRVYAPAGSPWLHQAGDEWFILEQIQLTR